MPAAARSCAAASPITRSSIGCSPTALRARVSPRRVRGRGAQPLHQALQLHQQRHRQRQPAQRVGQHRREDVRVHLVDRRLRQDPAADDAKSTGRAPEDSYGIAKYAVELELRACRELFGLDYVIFRPHNVYGPRQNIGDRYRNVVGIFMNQILQGQPMTIFGDGTQTRAFSYIDDVAPMIAEAIDTPASWNQTFNVGADQPVLAAAAGRRRCRGDGRPGQRSAPRGAPRGAARALVARQGAAGVRRAAADAARRRARSDGRVGARHGARTSAPFDGIEIAKNLPAVMAGAVTGYHAAHLPEDPARAIVWKVVARASGGVGAAARARARARRRLLRLDQQRVGRAARVAVDIWPDVARYAAPGVEAVVLDVVARTSRGLGASAFDVVLASNVLEHFEPDVAASVVDDVGRAAEAGRTFRSSIQPNFRYASRQYFDDYTHRAVFTDVSLPSAAAGARVPDRSSCSRGSCRTRCAAAAPDPAMAGARVPASPLKPMAGQMLVVAHREPAQCISSRRSS